MAAPVRIRILRNSIIEGHGEAKAGEEFEVSPYAAAMLTSIGAAEYVKPEAKPYTVTSLVPDHGDPAPRKVASAPPKVKDKKGPRLGHTILRYSHRESGYYEPSYREADKSGLGRRKTESSPHIR